MNNTATTETESLRTFIANQIARCERSMARGQAELDALAPMSSFLFGSGDYWRRVEAGQMSAELLFGARDEMKYWLRRQAEA